MIMLKDVYRGRPTNERAIPPGEYAEDDERLFGLADYLVEIGAAERMGSKAKGKERPADPQPDAEKKDDSGDEGEKPAGVVLDETNRPKVENDQSPADPQPDAA